MEFVAAWLATPLILLLLCLGLGLLIHSRNSGEPNLPMVLAGGFALLSVIGSLSVQLIATAKLTGLVAAALAILGISKGLERLKILIRESSVFVVILISYVLAGLPALALRKVTWPGWVQLDDTATFLAITNHIMSKGYVVPQVPVATYDRTLNVNLVESYPVGSLVPLGVTGQLSRVDLAWLYFPYLVFCVALVAGLMYFLIRKFLPNKWIAGLAAITAAHASTFYAYALWGGIKEVSLVPVIIYSLYALNGLATSQRRSNSKREKKSREPFLGYILLALLTTYLMGGTSGIGFILGESILFSIYYFVRRNQNLISAKTLLPLLGLAIVGVLLFRPISAFFNKYLIPEMPDSGNLGRPLNFLQIFGIWPSGDFRLDIYWQPYSYAALGMIALLTVIGTVMSLRSNLPLIAIGLVTMLTISVYSSIFNGVWLTGKAIAVASPFFVLATIYGISQLINIRQVRVIGYGLLAFVVLGVGSSNYLAYRYVWMAPSEKVQELKMIGERFKGEGPTLLTDYAVFAGRYFLRELTAESASELRVNPIPMRDGKQLDKGLAADIDLFDNVEISKYELLVLRHAPTDSRPLFNYDLAYRGKYYDVWKKNEFGDLRIKSIPIGTNFYPALNVSCPTLAQVTAGVTGKIYAAQRQANYRIPLTGVEALSGTWYEDQGNVGAIIPSSDLVLRTKVKIKETGTYEWFIDGSYPGKLTLLLDGKELFTGKSFLEGNHYLTSYLFTGKVKSGEREIELRYERPLTQVGAGINQPMGPIYLSNNLAADAQVISADASAKSSLCNKDLDWLAWVEG